MLMLQPVGQEPQQTRIRSVHRVNDRNRLFQHDATDDDPDACADRRGEHEILNKRGER